VAANRGLLHLRDLREILAQQAPDDYFYPRSKHKYIISLMKKFELCYNVTEDMVLIPQLLDVAEPIFTFDEQAALRFVLSYDDFLPLSIMPRFIVKRHQDIKDQLRWRTGVVLENKAFQAIAVVRADNEARRITIAVNGPQRKDYLAVVLLFFREINDSFEKLKVSERVPLPDNPEVTVSYQHLLTLAQAGVDQQIFEGSSNVYRISDLLGMIQLDERGGQEILDIVRGAKGEVADKESFIEALNRIVDLKPNVIGFGINLNELIERWYNRQKDRRDSEEDR
jgi:hypothetical protein